MRLAPTELTFVSKFRSVLLGDVLARRVPVSAFCRYRVSLQRKKRCQQIIGLDDESFSVAVRIDAKKKSVLGEMFGDAVRPAHDVGGCVLGSNMLDVSIFCAHDQRRMKRRR